MAGLVMGLALAGAAGIAVLAGVVPEVASEGAALEPIAARVGAEGAAAGPVAVAWPWSAIGRVTQSSGGYCTGTLIAPDLVLTAGHCVTDAERGMMAPDQVTFEAGYRDGTSVALGRVTKILRPDDAAMPGTDVALLKLAAPLEVRPLSLLSEGEPPKGHGLNGRAILAGYEENQPGRLTVERGCLVLGLAGATLARHTCTTVNGSSGGPLLWNVEPSRPDAPIDLSHARVAGVAVGYAADGSSPAGVLVTAPAVRAFIQTVGTLAVGADTEGVDIR